MPTPFSTHSSGQVIASADINLIQSAVVDLEKGSALYSVETAGSAANAYVASPAPGAPDPLTAGYHVRLQVTHANTGASTLDVGATAGAVAITKRGGTALESGDMPAGLVADLVYDGTGWTLQNPQPGTGSPSGGMTLIEEKTGAAASYNFAAVPGTYRVLRIYYQIRTDHANGVLDLCLRLNGDAGANYDNERAQYYSTSLAAYQGKADSYGYAGFVTGTGADANKAGCGWIDLPLYAGTAWFKNWVAQSIGVYVSGTGNHYGQMNGGLWRSASAITQVTLFPSTGNIVANSWAALFGIA